MASSTSTNTIANGLQGTNASSNRMFALAAALDAGDAVGKLMADMMMLGTPPAPATSTGGRTTATTATTTATTALRLTGAPSTLR
eukprot:gene20852-15365_t